MTLPAAGIQAAAIVADLDDRAVDHSP